MDVNLKDLRSERNPKARIKVMNGHFASSHSHLNTYIDISTVSCRHNNARETAKVLAEPYSSSTEIDTIVCLDGTEVIGAFLAEILAEVGSISVNAGKNISVICPELNQHGQMMFRDNTKRMIGGQHVLILAGAINTGKTMLRAMDTIVYYGGNVCGVCAIFSAATKVAGLDIHTIFSSKDVPDYQVYGGNDCPLCKAGRKVDAIVNGFGFSSLS